MSRIRANLITNQTANGAPNFTNGLFVTGVATVTNNLNVGGVLTYEDVTNVDSVGVITARSGIRIGATGANTLISGTATGIGIGTDDPNTVLHIQQDIDNSSNYWLNAGNTVHIKNTHASGYASLRLMGGGTGSDNNAIVWGGQGSESLILANRQNERLRIGSAGQIGIGGANYGTNTSTYNSNTGKSKQALVSNGGSAAPAWAYTNRPAFMARKSSSQNIDTSTWTKVQIDQEVLDTDNAYDNTTNYRFTVPTGGAGWYMCHFSTGIDDVQDSDYVYARLYVNGSAIDHALGSGWCSAANAVLQAATSHMVYLDDGDYLELYVYHNEGSTEPVEQNRCYFGAFRLNI